MKGEIDKAIILLQKNGYEVNKEGVWYLGRKRTEKARYYSYYFARSLEASTLAYCTEYTVFIPEKFDWKKMPTPLN